jgi:succinate dehydrogenase / fumarate reductase iron-sulfur subunit
MKLNVKIFRFDPDKDEAPSFKDYVVEAGSQDRVLDCLNRIRWEQDGTLAYRMSCAHGVCGSDAMRINGRCALACQKLIKDIPGEQIIIEPLPSFRVLKDLIVDLTPFFAKVDWVRPYLVASHPPEKERLQSPQDQAKISEAIRCILCACCVGACPVSNADEAFLGPAPLVQAFRRIFDSRDEEKEQRLQLLNNPDGVWGCVNHFECTKACPKEILVTKHINELKRLLK